MKKQMPYSVPEGYFQEMARRLETIPAKKSRHTSWAPAFAFAAIAAITFVAGGLIFRKPATNAVASVSVMTLEDEIVEYLIDSGTSVYCLEDNSL